MRFPITLTAFLLAQGAAMAGEGRYDPWRHGGAPYPNTIQVDYTKYRSPVRVRALSGIAVTFDALVPKDGSTKIILRKEREVAGNYKYTELSLTGRRYRAKVVDATRWDRVPLLDKDGVSYTILVPKKPRFYDSIQQAIPRSALIERKVGEVVRYSAFRLE